MIEGSKGAMWVQCRYNIGAKKFLVIVVKFAVLNDNLLPGGSRSRLRNLPRSLGTEIPGIRVREESGSGSSGNWRDEASTYMLRPHAILSCPLFTEVLGRPDTNASSGSYGRRDSTETIVDFRLRIYSEVPRVYILIGGWESWAWLQGELDKQDLTN